MYYAGVARTIGVNVNVLTPDEVKEIWPLCETDGHPRRHPASRRRLHPARRPDPGARQGRARAAARRSTATRPSRRSSAQPSRRMAGETDKGDIVCEHVVSATGNFARRTGAMVGLDIPVHPGRAPVHRHRAASGDPGAPRARACPRWACCARANSSWYMREENGGLLLGPYEKGAPACYVDGPSEESEYELFQEDLDRLDAAYRDGDRPRAGLRRGRHQEGL